MNPIASDPLDRTQFPLDEWALTEAEFHTATQGRTETLFAVGNGYLGLRGNFEEGHKAYAEGTFINGFHDTWQIKHAEEAYGFARVGQTIVNVPDARVIRLYVDDEPFVVADADTIEYSRRLDFRTGVLERVVEWRTPSGKRVLIRSRRLVSFTDRHLAVIDYEVTMLDSDASVLISSQILNRQDRVDEYTPVAGAGGAGIGDPRKASSFSERVLLPRFKWIHEGRYVLGYRAANSGMTLAVGAEHHLETANEWDESAQIDDDIAKQVYRVRAKAGQRIRLVKTIAYHTSSTVPTSELADRANRTLDRIRETPIEEVFARQEEWLADFWRRSDVVIPGQPAVQQAVRWNIFQLAQSTARTDGGGIAAKGVSGSGYGGHYFWDTEIYVLPFLTYTSPQVARNALRFRQGMLPAARDRAVELNQRGALFPWRTINGLESSAYYAAGTAQYHIDADISHALSQYVAATGDDDFLRRGAIDILVETARMWADLGFWRGREGDHGPQTFHIHGVTGPDEYTTVVNDNLFTNVMARANLRAAVRQARRLRHESPDDYAAMAKRLDLTEDEIEEWSEAAEAMHILFDADLGIHPQDAQFLEKELWDLENTPASKRPLLLHFHPLVIYRFQVIKQADVVLALFLQGDEFTTREKRANFEYYDALTTGDSTLSASTQAIIAAEVGYRELALGYFQAALFVDLGDLHHNTADGIHVASTGGVWSALAFGFGGMRDYLGKFTFDPRLPEEWESMVFHVTIHGSLIEVDLRQHEMTFTILGPSAPTPVAALDGVAAAAGGGVAAAAGGGGRGGAGDTGSTTAPAATAPAGRYASPSTQSNRSVEVWVRGERVLLVSGTPVTVPLADDRPTIEGAPTTSDIEGTMRADGSVITASMPTIVSDIEGPESIVGFD
ncbi:glycoside hydrolase family 65 protein [Herbiconiux flava]|uniref:Alpha,alpha-trehalose phosphorylase n=1 Tax=Herbiconiux flava TaxID=881268 RepID=A0A852SLF8_9MICO|nr:glycosyl hydrolase family 65 protein [Herbiconiux flava]NYD69741.1 alpha,alpha-trehalose phosphorylase [Herbiconiux flava]GLK16489.1 kojibiose phosphorylase [Herbiconiux flava]